MGIVWSPAPPPADWRVGLTVKPKYQHDPLFGQRGAVLEVHSSGYGGIDSPHGVLRIQLASGDVILRAADDWVTA